jgi:hypothetical protein
MLGLGDSGVSLAFILTLGSTALCAVYGFINWNKPAPEVEIEEIAEEEAWEKNEVRGGQQ